MAGAIETKKQENGSKIVFESVIEKGKFPTTSTIEKVYPNVPAKWVDNYKLQSEALKKYLGSNKGYVYSRDDGIMPFIERLANKEMGVTKKDAWNPMDIIMVKKQGQAKCLGPRIRPRNRRNGIVTPDCQRSRRDLLVERGFAA